MGRVELGSLGCCERRSEGKPFGGVCVPSDDDTRSGMLDCMDVRVDNVSLVGVDDGLLCDVNDSNSL